MGDKTAVDGDLGVKGEGRRTRDRERESVARTPSTLFKAGGSSPESEERTRDCYFHMTLARAGEALVFHFNSVAKQ